MEPLGYDHQVSDLRLFGNSAYLAIVCLGFAVLSAGSAFGWWGKQADIRVAMCVGFQVLRFLFESSFLYCSKLATEGGMRSIGC